jgi:DNA-binding NarL/FixJ family response regulator
LTVLVVDDHPTFRRFARRLLEDAGFSVVGEAIDCASCLSAAALLQPSAILLDVLLPDGSGLDVAALLARRGGYGGAVVLTSSRRAADFGAALSRVPAAGFIDKESFSAEAFASILDAAL